MLPSRSDAPDPAARRGRRMTAPADRRRGPSIRAVAVLAVSAIALIATSQTGVTIERHAIGQVVLNGGDSVERALRVHVDPEAGQAKRGSIYVTFQAASGLDSAYTRDASLTLASASDDEGSFTPDTFPVDRCQFGCDLTYRIALAAGPSVLPGSLIRYDVDVRLEYDFNTEPSDPSLVRLDLEGMTTGPVAPIWALLAGLIAAFVGVAVGPAVHRALAPNRRRWPAIALTAFAIGLIAWILVEGAISIVTYGAVPELVRSPILLLLVADPWSVTLLGTLGWGVRRGLRQWPADGGWLLGLSAVAIVGLGGLWLAWRLTLDAVVQPLLIGLPFMLLGGVGGIVIGQAWRTDERGQHDRWWGALAVLSHGILIAGFGFLAERSFFDPFSSSPTSLLALIPAALLTLAFRRWFRGGRAWLVLFDIVIAGTGLLGAWLWSTSFIGFTTTPSRLEIDDVGVYLAVAASLVAVVTSFRSMPRGPTPKPPRLAMPTAPVPDLPATR